MSDEIQDRGIPNLYYHVWDNGPTPTFNKQFYDSCEFIGCISKLTHNIVKELCGPGKCKYIPHGIDIDIFKPLSAEERIEHKSKMFNKKLDDRFVLFYNSRNARRKSTSSIVESYRDFANLVGKDKVFFLMHTDPADPEGANLLAVCEMLGLTPDQIAFSKEKIPAQQINIYYNICDCTINASNNEGFGLSCLESLACGRQAIVNKTGGLQDQIFDDEGNELGVCMEPLVRTLTGSQEIPWILDDRNSVEQMVQSMLKLYNQSKEEKEKKEKLARDWVLKKFTKEQMIKSWDEIIMEKIELYKNGNPNRIKFGKI